jgi:hypothetical protein
MWTRSVPLERERCAAKEGRGARTALSERERFATKEGRGPQTTS